MFVFALNFRAIAFGLCVIVFRRFPQIKKISHSAQIIINKIYPSMSYHLCNNIYLPLSIYLALNQLNRFLDSRALYLPL